MDELTLYNAPRNFDVLRSRTPHTMRQLMSDLGGLKTGEQMAAWHKFTPDERVKSVIEHLLRWDAEHPGEFTGTVVAPGPQPQSVQPQYAEAPAPMNHPPPSFQPQQMAPQQPQYAQQPPPPQYPPQMQALPHPAAQPAPQPPALQYAQQPQQPQQPPPFVPQQAQQQYAPPQQNGYPQQAPQQQQMAPQQPQYPTASPPPHAQAFGSPAPAPFGGFTPPAIVVPPIPQPPTAPQQQLAFQGQPPQPASVAPAAQNFATGATVAEPPKRGRRSPATAGATAVPEGADILSQTVGEIRDALALLTARADVHDQLLKMILAADVRDKNNLQLSPLTYLPNLARDAEQLTHMLAPYLPGKG